MIMITGHPTLPHARHVAPVLKVAPEEIALTLFAFLTHFRSCDFLWKIVPRLAWLDRSHSKWEQLLPSLVAGTLVDVPLAWTGMQVKTSFGRGSELARKVYLGLKVFSSCEWAPRIRFSWTKRPTLQTRQPSMCLRRMVKWLLGETVLKIYNLYFFILCVLVLFQLGSGAKQSLTKKTFYKFETIVGFQLKKKDGRKWWMI